MNNKILFVNHIAHDFINGAEPLGLMHLSTIAKKNGFETKLIYPDYKLAINTINEWKPSIIAYSITTDYSDYYLKFNSILKNSAKFLSIFGGPHTTFSPEFIYKSKDIDMICIGEGERPFDLLLQNINKSNSYLHCPNFWVRNGENIIKNKLISFIDPLDEIGFPDRALLYDDYNWSKHNPIKVFMTIRGCPFNCTYCFNEKYKELYAGLGKSIRRRHVNHVIEEIKYVKENYPLKIVSFMDDTFNIMPSWIEEFSEKYRSTINLPFTCNARLDLLNESIIKNLKNAGCSTMALAIEAGNDNVRFNILNRKMSRKKIMKSMDLLKKYNIYTLVQNILGLPGTSFENDIETYELNKNCKVDYAHSSVFQPYPGTPLTEYAIKHNYFDGDYSKLKQDDYLSGISRLNINNKIEIQRLNKLFAFAVYLRLNKETVSFLVHLPLLKVFQFMHMLFKAYFGRKLYGASYSIKQIIINIVKLQNKSFR